MEIWKTRKEFTTFPLHNGSGDLILDLSTLDCPKKGVLTVPNERVKKNINNHFHINIVKQGFNAPGERFSSGFVDLETYPAYTEEIVLESDSSTLEIPINMLGSYLKVYGAYKLQTDTVRINRLTLYGCSKDDKIFTVIEYYKVIEGELSDKPYKMKRKVVTGASKCKKEIPPEISLSINNLLYRIKMQPEERPMEEVTLGHAYRPRNPDDKNGNYKKRVTYIHFSSIAQSYIKFGSVRLK